MEFSLVERTCIASELRPGWLALEIDIILMDSHCRSAAFRHQQKLLSPCLNLSPSTPSPSHTVSTPPSSIASHHHHHLKQTHHRIQTELASTQQKSATTRRRSSSRSRLRARRRSSCSLVMLSLVRRLLLCARRRVVANRSALADSISKRPLNLEVWKVAAPKIVNNKLGVIFLECSYPVCSFR